MSLTVEYATDPVWADEEHTEINLMVKFEEFADVVPFTASPNDTYTTYGPELFANAEAGDYGPVDPYVPPPTILSISPKTLASAITGGVYSASLTASGGTAPYKFSLSSGNLPVGLSISNSGAINGVPSESGDFSFVVNVTDYSKVQGNATISLTVYQAGGSDINVVG